ncbi:MAG: hypothetical protein AAGC55_17565 [Myxococcota bacterium]
MNRCALSLLIAVTALLIPATSSAERGFGLGAQVMLTGPVGASVTYDTGVFHIDGLLGLDDNDVTLGGRFFYRVHDRGVSDLSIGGGLAIVDEGDTDVHLEAGAKIRVWLVSNVAFNATVGVGLIIQGEDDAYNDLVLGGQVTGLLGITYFFT